MKFISKKTVLSLCLSLVGYDAVCQNRVMEATNEKRFRGHYGSNANTIAVIWFDLCHHNDKEITLSEEEQTEKSLKCLLAAFYYLYLYPRNMIVFESRFQYMTGSAVWLWARRIAALKKIAITWPEIWK